jgi:tetratricopeptide (TPR) repeat protein
LLMLDEAKYAESEKLLRDALEVCQRKLSDDHPMSLTIMDNLAELHDRQGRHDQAETLFQKVLELRQVKIGEDHPDTLTTMHGLAIAQSNQGKLDEAKSSLRHVIEVRKRVQSPEHVDLAAALAELGGIELKEKRYAEAERPLREALEILQLHLPNDWHRFDTESMLGASLLGQKKFADAEPLLLSSYAELRARESTIPTHSKSHITEALQRIIELYVAQARDDKAAEWRKQLESIRPAGI